MKQFVLRSGPAFNFTKTVHIAVDFGTTFSAAAYAIDHGTGKSFDTRDIQIITQYPDGEESDNDKNEVPTELLYKEGEKHPCAWGWSARSILKNSQVPHRLRPYFASRFKLLLSAKDDKKDIREELEHRFTSDGRVPLDLIVDFLAPFRVHILQYIQRKEDDEAEFLRWRQKWTFTVPADWTPYARREMLDAVRAAGFEGDLKLISEPEAAALYILEKRAEERKKLSLEDAAVVGDLGGGTIDGATYLISGLEPLSLSGLAFVTGRVVGSNDLNDGFRKAMKARLEPVAHQLRRDSGQSLDQILDELVDWFEVRKRSFRGPKHRTMHARISYLKEDPERGFGAAQIEIPSEDIVAIFEPVIEEVVTLLREQVKASVHFRTKGISRSKFKIEKLFLTGGLAGNPYVYERVGEEFENPRVVNYKIPVVTPPQPETAVVQGAVWRSLHPEKVDKRISDTSYGFRQDESWTEGWPYGGPEPVRNPITEALEVKDRMKWVVKKGEGFKNNHRVPYRLERYIPVGGSLEFQESLYYSDIVKEDHIYYEHPNIHPLGVLEFSLEKWRKRFNRNTNDKTGEEYMMIEYDLVSMISEDNWTYEIEVLGSKTCFKKSENITAGFKLSQGYIQS